MAELLNNPAILIGLGDGGAHVDMLCDSGYPTYLLGTWVREREGVNRGQTTVFRGPVPIVHAKLENGANS